MAKTHVTLRFNEQTMFVIQQYQSKHETADRTDAVEGIIADYWKMLNRPLSRLRRAFMPDLASNKTLEEFAHAQT